MDKQTAMTKWCPYAAVRDKDGGGPTNRFTGRDNETRCLADGCMAWRGTTQAGYCGLAGKDPPA